MKKFLVLMVVAAMTLFGVSAFAGVDLKMDDDTFAKFGAKARIQYSATSPGSDKLNVGLGEGRIYFSGQITNTVKFGFNYDFATTGGAAGGGRATDALVQFDLATALKINTGIYRMAFSRLALQDSYQYILISSPEVGGTAFVTNTNLGGFRVGGVTAWGDLADGMIRYNVGISDGSNGPAAVAGDELGISGRVVVNFMDPEKGYTCPGCYLGKAKVANVGVGFFQQENSAGTVTQKAVTVDGFYDANNLTIEAALFNYDYDNAAGQKPVGMYVEAAYAFGKIQPAVRFEQYDDDVAANDTTDFAKLVVGVNYLIDGHNAKVGFELAQKDFDGGGVDTDTATIQVQAQF
ncbi:MAG: hypothetical protein A2X56_08905 [Nitrospirae bacterium GWC2_57_13]|nr:MAG: hypothetical protein A2X56_08905 [Nitrospirae bacterium GWC2_57_13]